MSIEGLLMGALSFFAPTLDPDLATTVEVGFAVLAVGFLLWTTVNAAQRHPDRPLAGRVPTLIGYVLAVLVLVIALERVTVWIV